MRFVDLYAGIGGLSLGLERAGWTCVGHAEIDPFCRAVLRKHWPVVPLLGDVRELTGSAIRDACGPIDAIVGGVPCQPASVAGKRTGADDPRWLWPDFLRVVREVSPRIVLAENVPGLASSRASRPRLDLR